MADTVRDVMTLYPTAVPAETTLAQAARLMRDKERVRSSLPVRPSSPPPATWRRPAGNAATSPRSISPRS